MHQHVFHAYDIRGLTPQEIDPMFARRLARAAVQAFQPTCVLIGHDMRPSSTELEEALVYEFMEQGVDTIRIGLCSTPVFNVSVGLAGEAVDLGIMVTASHNPAEYNGFKFVRRGALPIGNGSGMEELATAFEQGSSPQLVQRLGKSERDDHAMQNYLAHILTLAKLPPEMPMIKIAVDCGNGMGGPALSAMSRLLPWLEIVPLYFEPDGTFPNHEANPLKTETLAALCETVVKKNCAFGLAFDGDADRVGLVDEQGTIVPGDLAMILLAQTFLADAPGGNILYDLRCSWSVPEAISKLGGVSHMTRVGHSFIKKQMNDERALFGGELSMHYYFHDLWNVESGDLFLLLMLKLLASSHEKLSEIWRGFSQYAHSGEINFRVQDASSVLERVKDRYAATATRIDEIDGARMEFRDPAHPDQDWWFSVRRSNTEPLVRLNLEAKTPERMEEKKNEVSAMLV